MKNLALGINKKKVSLMKQLGKNVIRHYELYLFVIPPLAYFIVFAYLPMYGVQIAFKSFMPALGISGSPWIGFRHFVLFYNSFQFRNLISNTFIISIYSLAAGFPAPIILALLLHDISNQKFKKLVQTATYAPHFISVVTVCGMILLFLSPRSGIIPHILRFVGIEPILYIANPVWFRHIYVISGIWQSAGFGAIIYFAALSAIDKTLYEAAIIDGATKFQRIIYIDIASLIPTITIMLILSCGGLLSVGFEKAFLLQNDLNIRNSEVISTYVYKTGLQGARYSYTTAIGLFNSVINFVLLATVNFVARRLGQSSLW